MTEGDLVVVVGKLDTRIKDVDTTKLVTGTYLGTVYATNHDLNRTRQAQVLLEDGTIWTGNEYDVAPAGEQDDRQSEILE